MNGNLPPPSNALASQSKEVEVLPQGTILIAGGGPVGLTLSTTLAHYGVQSVVLERNLTTTKWPKMDLTNVRSMELFRKLGLADKLRKQGVASHQPQTVLMSTGLGAPKAITEWRHPSVDEFRLRIASQNDGSMPLEPWQRLSQETFERWLKGLCDANPLIDLRFGCKVESVEELDDGVRVSVTDVVTGVQRQLVSRYLVGCDGGSSRVRRSLSIPLDGGPMPAYVLLVHFKSRDLTRLHKQGRFWHIFFVGEGGLGSAIIAQNETDTWTTHLMLPMDVDSESISSQDAVYQALGALHEPYPITIDKVLVRSTYRPNIAIARSYSGAKGHVYLAGDAAHQNIPTGGYGMNMGIADAFELGWRLAAVVNGHARAAVLKTYEQERRPVAMTSIERSGVHMRVHMDVVKKIQGKVRALDDDTEEGRELQKIVREHYREHDGENTDWGIEMGYIYRSNIVIPDGTVGPKWTPTKYVPSTFPGSRAPHVFLRDGSPIFDHFGKHYTLVEFSDGTEKGASVLMDAAWRHWVAVKHLVLVHEEHAASIYERRLLLVRPDGHVAWRADEVTDATVAMDVFATIAGDKESSSDAERAGEVSLTMDPTGDAGSAFTFTSTIGTTAQTANFELEKMGGFQS